MISKIIIFTDLDGSLLHRDNFKFDEIKDFLKSLINEGIIMIPNTSKTEKEIEDGYKIAVLDFDKGAEPTWSSCWNKTFDIYE